MRNITRLILVFSLWFSILCCKREPYCPYEDEHRPWTPEARATIPYSDFDTLDFVHRKDNIVVDTLQFIGTGMVTSKEIMQMMSLGGDCVYNITGDVLRIQFKRDTGNSIMFYAASAETGGYLIINYGLYNTINDVLDWIDNPNSPSYYPTLNLNGIQYYDVNKFEGTRDTTLFRVYYTATEGIIRMETELANETFDLL